MQPTMLKSLINPLKCIEIMEPTISLQKWMYLVKMIAIYIG